MKITIKQLSPSPLLLLLVSLGLLWGSSFPLAKYVMSLGVPPLGYAFYQSLGATIVLLSYHFWSRHPFLVKRHWPMIKHFIVVSFLGCIIPNLNRFYLTTEVPSGILALVINTTPLFIYPLALLLRDETFIIRRCAGVIIGFIGILLVIFHQNILVHIALNYKLLSAFITPLSYALCSIYIAKTAKQIGNASLYAMGMLFFSTLFLAMAALGDHQALIIPPILNAYAGIACEIVLSSMGYMILFKILQRYGSVSYSTTDGITIITSLLLGSLFFKETIHLNQFIAILCIIIGIKLVITNTVISSKESI